MLMYLFYLENVIADLEQIKYLVANNLCMIWNKNYCTEIFPFVFSLSILSIHCSTCRQFMVPIEQTNKKMVNPEIGEKLFLNLRLIRKNLYRKYKIWIIIRKSGKFVALLIARNYSTL